MKLESRRDVQDFVRGKIAELLGQCSQSQRDLFFRLFGGGAEKVPSGKLCTALDLCERAVTKNERTGRLRAKKGKV